MKTKRKDPILPCSKVLEHIQAELDTKSNLTAYRQIQKHLENCPNCMRYLDSLKKVVYLYKYFSNYHPGKESHKKLWAAVKLEMRL